MARFKAKLAAVAAAISVAFPLIPTYVESNPVTYAQNATGSGIRYDVYSDADFDVIPFGAIGAGDVVNIFYKASPYLRKFGVRGQGTETNPILINGVTDAFGNRPQLNFQGARTALACNSVPGKLMWGTDPANGESLGGIVVIRKSTQDDYYTYKPDYVYIQNLEVFGAAFGNTYTTLAGDTVSYGAGAGIYLHACNHPKVENCVVRDNGFGIFMMAKDDLMSQCVENPIVRNSRVYGNGVPGSNKEHGFYVQATNPIIEGNFIGTNKLGTAGSSYKSRSSNELFRCNWVESSDRACDWVHSEGSIYGIGAEPGYGTTRAYGNVIFNNCDSAYGGAGFPIHFGGDNLEEDTTGPLTTPALPYLTQLLFWNNTVINVSTTGKQAKIAMFDLSLVATKADVWNNVFYCIGDAAFSWLEYAGKLQLRGTNQVYGTLSNTIPAALAGRWEVNFLGTLITSDPLFMDNSSNDFRLMVGSAAIDAGTAAPAGIPAGHDAAYPILYQPMAGTNGLAFRTAAGSAMDLGALEYGSGMGPTPVAPVNTVLPVITGLAETGSTATLSNGTWSGNNTYTRQWKKNGVNISGATATTYTYQVGDAGASITGTVLALRSNGLSASATSVAVVPALPATLPATIGNSTIGSTNSNDNAPFVAVPAGAVAGDEYWMAIQSGSETNTVTWPAGFTEVAEALVTDANLGAQLRVARRTAVGSESGNFSATTSGYTSWAVTCVVVKGTSATPDASSGSPTYAYTATKPMTGAPITTTGANRTILWFGSSTSGGDAGALTLTVPAGLALAKSTDNGTGGSLSVAAGIKASAGAATYSGSAAFPVQSSRAALVSTIALIPD